MSNQDQYNDEAMITNEAVPVEFSTRRRVFTAILVLVAALLLGYVIYMMMFAPAADIEVTTPAEPELTAEEQAILRLQAFEQEPVVPPTAEQLEQLQALEQEVITPPTQEQLERLEQFRSGS